MPTFDIEELQAVANLAAMTAERLTGWHFIGQVVPERREIWVNTGTDTSPEKLPYNFILRPITGDLMTAWRIEVVVGGKNGIARLAEVMRAMRGVDDRYKIVKTGRGSYAETHASIGPNTLMSAANRLIEYIERVVAWHMTKTHNADGGGNLLTPEQMARQRQLESDLMQRWQIAEVSGMRMIDLCDHEFTVRMRVVPVSDDITPPSRDVVRGILQGCLELALEGGTHEETYALELVEGRVGLQWEPLVGARPEQDD